MNAVYFVTILHAALRLAVAETEPEIRIATDTSYLTLMDELLSVYCEDIGEHWSCYNDTTQFIQCRIFIAITQL